MGLGHGERVAERRHHAAAVDCRAGTDVGGGGEQHFVAGVVFLQAEV